MWVTVPHYSEERKVRISLRRFSGVTVQFQHLASAHAAFDCCKIMGTMKPEVHVPLAGPGRKEQEPFPVVLQEHVLQRDHGHRTVILVRSPACNSAPRMRGTGRGCRISRSSPQQAALPGASPRDAA